MDAADGKAEIPAIVERDLRVGLIIGLGPRGLDFTITARGEGVADHVDVVSRRRTEIDPGVLCPSRNARPNKPELGQARFTRAIRPTHNLRERDPADTAGIAAVFDGGGPVRSGGLIDNGNNDGARRPDRRVSPVIGIGGPGPVFRRGRVEGNRHRGVLEETGPNPHGDGASGRGADATQPNRASII